MPGIAPTFRTSRPCAVTTSGARPASAAIRPRGTRKCAQTTSGFDAAHLPPRAQIAQPSRRRACRAPPARPRCRGHELQLDPTRRTSPRSGSPGPGYIWETRRIRTAARISRETGAAVRSRTSAPTSVCFESLPRRRVEDVREVVHRRVAGSERRRARSAARSWRGSTSCRTACGRRRSRPA